MKPTPLHELIHFATTKRRQGKSWSFLHVRKNPDAQTVSFDEIRQILEHQFQSAEKLIYDFKNNKDILMVFHNKTRLVISQFEKALRESFGDGTVNIATSDLNENGFYLLNKILSDTIPADDILGRNLLKRLARVTNVALVLDDDKMILTVMTNVLKSFGQVESAETSLDFKALYTALMPNIVFVDIHLRGEKGPDIVRKMAEDIDPFMHAVMISSDSTRETVLSVKNAGGKGYIVKPFNRDFVYQHLLKAPTFLPRAA